MSSKSGIKPASRVLPHKLFTPRRFPGAVFRERLFQKIHAEPGTRVILLQAPAGHGKSTLLQQAKLSAEEAGNLTGWLALDDADNDFARFLTHIHALLRSLKPQAGGKTTRDPATQSRGRRGPEWLIAELDELARPITLFFDDFQFISQAQVLTFFKDFLEHLPEQVTVYLGSRSVPEVGLARLVAHQQALVLRADDLCFSAEEVSQFFSSSPNDLRLSAAEAQVIHEQTEGWPAALQLFRLSLVSPTVRGSLISLSNYAPRELAEYLADNVLSLQSSSVREFLLRTGHLTRLSAPLCDAVTGTKNSLEMLHQLERSGLFLRRADAAGEWYKYHGLFSAFLTEQLRELSERVVLELHVRAAHWYRGAEMYEEAMHHALAARDYSYAAEILEIWSDRLVSEGFIASLERWYDRLPLDEIEKRPVLLIRVGWALTFLRHRAKLEPIVPLLEKLDGPHRESAQIVRAMVCMIVNDDAQDASRIVSQIPVNGRNPEGFFAFELGAASNLRGYLALSAGDYEAARDYLSIGRAYSEIGAAPFSWAYSVSMSGVNSMIQGHLQEARERMGSAYADPRIILDDSNASSSLVSGYMLALYEAGDLDAAEVLFLQNVDILSNAVLDFVAVAYLCMARIEFARGQTDKANLRLEEAERIAHVGMWPRLLKLIGWERVRMALLQGEMDRARITASRIPRTTAQQPENWIPFSEDCEGNAIGVIRLAIERLELRNAHQLIQAELAAAVHAGRIRRQIKLHVLEACALLRSGDEANARQSLRRGLLLAEPGLWIRIFLDEGPAVIRLLQQEQQMAAKDSALRRYCDRLLAAAGANPATAPQDSDSSFQPLESLTPKEKKILSLLAGGASNKVIAQSVFLSENTIKFHLKNIYSKLAVSGRLQAVNAARQMGLIKPAKN